MRKEVREQIQYAESLGFKLTALTGSGHYRLTHPNGEVTIASSPSAYSGFANGQAQMRRIAGVGSTSPKQGRGRVKRSKVRQAPRIDLSERARFLRDYIRDCEAQERTPAGLPSEGVRKALNLARQELASLDSAARSLLPPS